MQMQIHKYNLELTVDLDERNAAATSSSHFTNRPFSSRMVGIFDRFRYDAKRKRNEDTVATCPDATNISENDEEEHTTKVVGKRGKHTANEPEQEKNSPSSGKWQERWHAICDDCFEQAHTCEHYPEHRLRLLIVGHNPSDHAWKTGYSYK